MALIKTILTAFEFWILRQILRTRLQFSWSTCICLTDWGSLNPQTVAPKKVTCRPTTSGKSWRDLSFSYHECIYFEQWPGWKRMKVDVYPLFCKYNHCCFMECIFSWLPCSECELFSLKRTIMNNEHKKMWTEYWAFLFALITRTVQIWCCYCGCCHWVKGHGIWLTARSSKSHVWYVYRSLLMSQSVSVALCLPSFCFAFCFYTRKKCLPFFLTFFFSTLFAGSRSCDPFSASNDVRSCRWSHVHRWTKASQWGEEFVVIPCGPARCFQQVKQCSRNRRNRRSEHKQILQGF